MIGSVIEKALWLIEMVYAVSSQELRLLYCFFTMCYLTEISKGLYGEGVIF